MGGYLKGILEQLLLCLITDFKGNHSPTSLESFRIPAGGIVETTVFVN
jgi:hypothetical protein